jgi:hypothetical protein
MAKFSLHNIRTVFNHLCSRERLLPELSGKRTALKSARAAMSELQDLLSLFRRADFDSYKLTSFAHWQVQTRCIRSAMITGADTRSSIVLYYPFTSYFVLFSHVVITGNAEDFGLMNEFVEYLAELRNSSAPFEKLHRLCLSFRSLAVFASSVGISVNMHCEIFNTTDTTLFAARRP